MAILQMEFEGKFWASDPWTGQTTLRWYRIEKGLTIFSGFPLPMNIGILTIWKK